MRLSACAQSADATKAIDLKPSKMFNTSPLLKHASVTSRMETHEGGLLRSEQHAHVITEDTTMLTSQEKLFGKATTRLGLATTVAALWIAAVPFASAAAAGTGHLLNERKQPTDMSRGL
jgi:hypothetical protein